MASGCTAIKADFPTATTTATGYHYLLGLEAPYPWYDLPVLLGTLGGLGLVIGPIGLLRAKFQRDSELVEARSYGMDVGFLVMLLLTSVTGLLLLVLRATPAMGILLALHIGIVFVHGFYRFLALVRYAKERGDAH